MRYPTHNGLALPVTELGFDVVSHKKGRTNNHHLYYCRSSYSGERFRSVFRNLVDHVVTMPIEQHETLHDLYKPPKIPADVLMMDVLEEYITTHGVLHVVRESATHEVREIQQQQWDSIRTGYKAA